MIKERELKMAEIKAKYYKDYQHNYLILICGQEDKEGSYRYRMLSLNKVDGLLNYSIRNVNGSTCLYYDISSKISIENLYQNKRLSYDQVKDFFIQLDQICWNLSHYFLEEKELLLQPQYIYFDLAAQKYYGVYYPQTDMEEENIYEALLDFLLTHIDSEDQKLASKVYQFYEMAEDNIFSIADGTASFLDDERAMSGADIEADILKEERDTIGADVCEINVDETDMETAIVHGSENIGVPYPENGRGPTVFFYIILSVLSLVGAVGAYFLYLLYELTQRELMILFGCGAIMAMGCPLGMFLAWRTNKRKKEKLMADRQLLADIEDEFRDSRPISLENVLDKNVYPSANKYRKASMGGKEKENVQAVYGETVFIDLNKQEPEYKLYALDSKNKKHIDLTHFPYTIGKMAGCVDCVLTDASISRLHARIEQKEGRIFLTDMNSTNGTYKNGLQMDPSETIEIEPGDEIRFGKLNYCYR